MNQKKTRSQKTIYTQEIMKALRQIDVGDGIAYAQINKLIGMDCQKNEGYRYQKSARDLLERDENIVFEVVENIGLRRLSHEEVAKSTVTGYLKRKKSLVRRKTTRINTVSDVFSSLSREAQEKATLLRTMLAFDNEWTKKNRIKKLAERVHNCQAVIGFEETLAMFRRSGL